MKQDDTTREKKEKKEKKRKKRKKRKERKEKKEKKGAARSWHSQNKASVESFFDLNNGKTCTCTW